jgi:hypothetical protein
MKTTLSILSLILGTCAMSAQAATLYTAAGATGELTPVTPVTVNVNAGAGAGLVSLQLQGYRTLDGDNGWIDIFHLAVNGTDVFTGTWDLGGGGGGPAEGIILNAPGAVATHTGSLVDISVPVVFLAGGNTVTFSYESPLVYAGTPRFGVQDIADEAWGINATTITGNSPVPEPSSYALVMAGLAVAGLWVSKGRKA